METDNLYKVDNVEIPKTVEGTTYVYNRKSFFYKIAIQKTL